MKKIVIVFLIFALSSCSLKFDPAGKLARQKASPTGTAASVPVLQQTAAPAATMTINCQVTGDLHLRAAPNASAKVVDYLLAGETVVASSGESAGWRAVKNWAGVGGYVNAKWLNCGGE